MISKDKTKNTGSGFIELLMINAIAPVLFLYGKINDDESYIDKAITMLEYLPSEKNNIITLWKELNIKASNAFDSQALIQLKTAYCDNQRCLSCKIGNEIMNGK